MLKGLEIPPMLNSEKQIESGEKLLEFGETLVAFVYSFPAMPRSGVVPAADLAVKLKGYGLEGRTADPLIDFCTIAEEFLFPEEIQRERYRLVFEPFTFANPTKEWPLPGSIRVQPMLSYYFNLGVCVMMFNVKLLQATTDDVIFLKHLFYGKRLQLHFSLKIFETGVNHLSYLDEVVDYYLGKVCFALTGENTIRDRAMATVTEIRQVKVPEILDPAGLAYAPKQIYGLMLSDEGWRFVPQATAQPSNLKTWTTRDFFNVWSLNEHLLVFNCASGTRYQDYLACQSALRLAYGLEPEHYFTFQPDFAGLNHGPLLVLENGLVMRTLLNQMLRPPKIQGSMKSFLEERDRLVQVLAKLSAISMRELSRIQRLVKENLQIDEDIIDLQERLATLERTLTFKYNKRINISLLALAVISSVVAIISLVATFVK